MGGCNHEHSEEHSAKTLADMVTQRPQTARVFEKYNLDYCCGGKRSLSEACAELNIDPGEVEKALTDQIKDSPGADPINLAEATISELCDHIVDVHHTYMKAELPRLTELMARVKKKHGEKHPELEELQSTFLAMKAEMQDHTKKEEEVLFPMSKELESANTMPAFHCGTICNPLNVMETEHDQTADQLKKIRSLTNDFQVPSDACPSFIALLEGLALMEKDLHMHIHKENNILHEKIRKKEAALSASV